MKKIIFYVLLAAAVGQSAEPSTNRVVLSAEYISLLSEGLRTNHPGVTAASARAYAAAENMHSVRTWDDPMIRLGGMAAREDMRAEDGDLIYGVEQKLPLFGKPQLAREVAKTEMQVAQANTEYQFQLRRFDFTKRVLEAAVSDRLVSVGQQDLQWLDTIIAALQQRFEAGQASQLDLLKAQNERAKRAERLKTDRNQGFHQRVAMNLMLARPLYDAWVVFDLPSVASPIVHTRQLENLSLKFEPKLRMMRQEVQRAEATARLTKRQQWPDVSAGVEARNYTGDGSFRQGMVLLSMNLPWGNRAKYRSDIRREEAKARATELETYDYELTVREEIHKLVLMIDNARREALLYRDQIIPRSNTALANMRAGWEAGRGMLGDVLEARRMLLEAETMYTRAVAEQYTAMAELVLCCGLADLQALEMLGISTSDSPSKQK
jgi:outer membrane protein, heavy metal efflux system